MARDWQARLDRLTTTGDVPGAVLGVVSGGATQVYAAGVLNRRTGVAVTPDSVFQIGSITKVWTATQVMLLADQGRVDLDVPVSTLLPGLMLADTDQPITVRHLLTHTAGIEGDVFDDVGSDDDCLGRYAAAMADHGMVHAPGETWSYCNSGYVLLGRLIEVVTGMSWHRALREQIVEPLGMTSVCTSADEAILHGAAVGHLAPPGQDVLAPTRQWGLPRALSPAGLITCGMGDLLSFARLHLDHGRTADGPPLLDAGTVAEMQQPHAVCMEDRLASHWGLGWMLNTWSGRQVIGHGGNTIGQAALLYLVPDDGVAVALQANAGGRGGVMLDLVREVLAEEAGVTIPPQLEPGQTPAPQDLQACVGVYERHSVRTEVWEVDGQLHARSTMTGPVADALGVTEPMSFDLHPVRPDVFVARVPLYGSEWVPVRFHGGAGQHRFLHLGGRASRRVTTSTGT